MEFLKNTGKNQRVPDFVKTVCQLWNSYEFHNGSTVWKCLFHSCSTQEDYGGNSKLWNNCGISQDIFKLWKNCGKTVEKLLSYSVTWI